MFGLCFTFKKGFPFFFGGGDGRGRGGGGAPPLNPPLIRHDVRH